MNPWPDWHACNAWCEGDEHAFVATYGGGRPPTGVLGRVNGVYVQLLEERLAPEAERNPQHPDWPVWLTRVRVLGVEDEIQSFRLEVD